MGIRQILSKLSPQPEEDHRPQLESVSFEQLTYDFEIYNIAAPILSLRLYGELEFVCDAIDELDGFFASRNVNPKLETAIAGFLQAAFNTEYRRAASHMETIVGHGYFPSILLEQGRPAILRLEPSDGNWDRYFDTFSSLDCMNFGGDLGNVSRACVFSSRPYQFDFHSKTSSGFNAQIFGGTPCECDTTDQLSRLLSDQGANAKFATNLSGFIGSALSKDYTQAARHLEKVYEQGYFVRFEIAGEAEGNLYVIRGEGGGWDELGRSLDVIDPGTLDGDAKAILQACIFSTMRPILSHSSPLIYEFVIYNIDTPLVGLKLEGEDPVDFDTFDQLDRHMTGRGVNIELEAALVGFLREAFDESYARAASHLETVLSYGYMPQFESNPSSPIILRVLQKKLGEPEDFFLSLPVDDAAYFNGYPDKLLKACVYTCTPFDLEIHQPASRLRQLINPSSLLVLRAYGDLRFKGDSLDELKQFLDTHEENKELASAICNFIHHADEYNYLPAARNLAKIYELGYFVRLVTYSHAQPSLRVVKGHGHGWKGLAASLTKPRIEKNLAQMLTSCMVACQQELYVSESPEAARDAARRFSGLRAGHVIEDIRNAQEIVSNDPENAHPLAKSMATGSDDYLGFFKGKTCNHPVKDFEISTGGSTFVCCPSYLPHAIGNLFTAKSADELIYSRDAKLIRESIAKQDFRFCRWLHCKEIDSLIRADSSKAKTDIYPDDFRLSYDSTCNLWCVTCRKEKLTVRGEEREIMMRATEEIIIPLLRKARSVTMNGYGDVFASKPCRQILSQVNSRDNPDLKINFITNAVLFTKQEWHNFSNIHDMMDSVRISIDAATKPTYDKIRLGGNWDILMENLRFLAQLRNEGTIKYLSISFVVQRDNFREMAEFAQLGKDLGCDMVIFEALLNWNTFSDEELQERSVHLHSNPLHAEFLDEVKRVRKVLPPATAPLAWQQKNTNKRITLLSLVNRF